MFTQKVRSLCSSKRAIATAAAAIMLAAFVLSSYPAAFAAFSSEAAEQVLGVGRIQSSAIVTHTVEEARPRIAAPEQLAVESEQESITQLVQPVQRSVDDAATAAELINNINRFGEPDENGWFHTTASAYGPSSAGQYTALGTELTLSSMDIGIDIDYIDLMGRWIYIEYGGIVIKTRIVDNGNITDPNRLFDLQPGLCVAFGHEPEFDWGVRAIRWKFAN